MVVIIQRTKSILCDLEEIKQIADVDENRI